MHSLEDAPWISRNDQVTHFHFLMTFHFLRIQGHSQIDEFKASDDDHGQQSIQRKRQVNSILFER